MLSLSLQFTDPIMRNAPYLESLFLKRNKAGVHDVPPLLITATSYEWVQPHVSFVLSLEKTVVGDGSSWRLRSLISIDI